MYCPWTHSLSSGQNLEMDIFEYQMNNTDLWSQCEPRKTSSPYQNFSSTILPPFSHSFELYSCSHSSEKYWFVKSIQSWYSILCGMTMKSLLTCNCRVATVVEHSSRSAGCTFWTLLIGIRTPMAGAFALRVRRTRELISSNIRIANKILKKKTYQVDIRCSTEIPTRNCSRCHHSLRMKMESTCSVWIQSGTELFQYRTKFAKSSYPRRFFRLITFAVSSIDRETAKILTGNQICQDGECQIF